MFAPAAKTVAAPHRRPASVAGAGTSPETPVPERPLFGLRRTAAPPCACGGGCPRCTRSRPVSQEVAATPTARRPRSVRRPRPAEVAAETEARQLGRALAAYGGAVPLSRNPAGKSAVRSRVSTRRRYPRAGPAAAPSRLEAGHSPYGRGPPLADRPSLPSYFHDPQIPAVLLEPQFQTSLVVSSTFSPDAGLGVGSVLSESLRHRLEPALGCGLAAVRLHTGAIAARMAAAEGAQAFAWGSHIVFADGAWAPHTATGWERLCHELVHVVQQTGRSHGPRAPPAGGDISGQIRHFQPGLLVQCDTATEAEQKDQSPGFLERVVNRIAPGMIDFFTDGWQRKMGEWFCSGLDTVLGWVLKPLGSVDLVSSIEHKFSSAQTSLESVAAGLKAKASAALGKLMRPVVNALKEYGDPLIKFISGGVDKVQGFFSGVWDSVGEPALDFLEKVGGAVWSGLKKTATWLEEKTRGVRNYLSRAWTWVKQKFNLAWESGKGVWDWISDKAAEIWQKYKAKLEPIIKPLKVLAAALILLSPLGPVVVAIKVLPAAYETLEWLYNNWNSKDILVKARVLLEKKVLPGVIKGATKVAQALSGAAGWLAEKLGALATKASGILSLFGTESCLRAVTGFFRAISQQFDRLAKWGEGGFKGLGDSVARVFHAVAALVTPILDFLVRLANVVANPPLLPIALGAILWLVLPDDLKPPVINFVLDLITVFVRAMPALLAGAFPLASLLKSAVLGFLARLRSLGDRRKIDASNKIANLCAGGGLAFTAGFAIGLLEGMWEGIADPFRLIAGLVKIVSKACQALAGVLNSVLENAPGGLGAVLNSAISTTASMTSGGKPKGPATPALAATPSTGKVQMAIRSPKKGGIGAVSAAGPGATSGAVMALRGGGQSAAQGSAPRQVNGVTAETSTASQLGSAIPKNPRSNTLERMKGSPQPDAPTAGEHVLHKVSRQPPRVVPIERSGEEQATLGASEEAHRVIARRQPVPNRLPAAAVGAATPGPVDARDKPIAPGAAESAPAQEGPATVPGAAAGGSGAGGRISAVSKVDRPRPPPTAADVTPAQDPNAGATPSTEPPAPAPGAQPELDAEGAALFGSGPLPTNAEVLAALSPGIAGEVGAAADALEGDDDEAGALAEFKGEVSTPASLADHLGGIWDAAIAGAGTMGAKAADAVTDFIMLPDYELGNKVGYVAGMVLFQALLAYFSGGATVELRAASPFIKYAVKFLDLGGEILGLAGKAIGRMAGPVSKALGAAKNSLGKLGKLGGVLEKIERAVASLAKFGDDAAGAVSKAAAHADDVGKGLVTHADDFGKGAKGALGHADDVGKGVATQADDFGKGAHNAAAHADDAVKSAASHADDAGHGANAAAKTDDAAAAGRKTEQKAAGQADDAAKHADDGKPAGKKADEAAREAAEKPAAILAARFIIEQNDALDTPPFLLKPQLLALQQRFTWIDDFEITPSGFGLFDIAMIASRTPLKKNYSATTKPSKIAQGKANSKGPAKGKNAATSKPSTPEPVALSEPLAAAPAAPPAKASGRAPAKKTPSKNAPGSSAKPPPTATPAPPAPPKVKPERGGATSTRKTTKRHPVQQPEVIHTRPGGPKRAPLTQAADQSAVDAARKSRDEAMDLYSTLPTDKANKTVSVGQSGNVKGSGWAHDPEAVAKSQKHLQQTGHTPKETFMDQGDPGRYNASHAEKQVIADTPDAHPGVSRPMCDDCIGAFQKEAQHQGKNVVVADPKAARVFEPDGHITEIWDDGTAVRWSPDKKSVSVAPGAAPPHTPSQGVDFEEIEAQARALKNDLPEVLPTDHGLAEGRLANPADREAAGLSSTSKPYNVDDDLRKDYPQLFESPPQAAPSSSPSPPGKAVPPPAATDVKGAVKPADAAQAADKTQDAAQAVDEAKSAAKASGEGPHAANAAGQAKPPVDEPALDKWSRAPKSLQDEMALQAAKSGQGEKIIDNLNDPRFKGMEKWELKVKSVDGKDSVVHYVRDPKNGELMDFKFKKHSDEEIGLWASRPDPRTAAPRKK